MAPKAPFELKNSGIDAEFDGESEKRAQKAPDFLKKAGCKIRWIGKRSVNVTGINELKNVSHKVIFDRIEAGTYIIASALTN